MFHPWTLPPTVLCHWVTALSVTRAAKRLFPSAGSPFPSRPFLSRDPGVFCLGTTADVRTGPFQHNIIDRHTGCRIWQVVIKTGGNRCFILHIGSPGCQRHGWTLNPNVLTCFKQEVCYVDGDRDTPQNHGSWISRELSWKNLIFQILIHQNMPHWTATIIVIAGEKLFSKRLWHRLRPPAVDVLDVHRGLRCQQLLGALHLAVVCCKMQRSPTSAPPTSEAPPAAAPRGFWAPGPIYHISFQVINIRTAHYSHWLTGIQEESPLQMSKTRMNSKITCFNKMCCVDRDRDMPQNHGSWISGELWRREPEMRNPGKSHARHAHRSWKNLKFQNLSHQNMPHWTATIIVIAGEKLFWKRLWHRLRPPAVVGLDVHRGLRRQQQLDALHAAAECCNMQRSVTSAAPQASEAPPAAAPGGSELPGRGCSGRPRPRPSPGERRRPPCGRGLLPRAARPGGPSHSRPRRVGRGSAGRGAGGPAPPPGRRRTPRRRCSRLGAGRNAAEMKFLSSFNLYVLSSLSPSLLLMEIILNKLETELIELISSWCSCYGTWSAT